MPQEGGGTPEGTRTPGLLLRRQLLYPAELLAHACPYPGREREYGAGDGNRTHTTSLEGWDSTIELHPHFATAIIIAHDLYPVNKKRAIFSTKSPFSKQKEFEVQTMRPYGKTRRTISSSAVIRIPAGGVSHCSIKSSASRSSTFRRIRLRRSRAPLRPPIAWSASHPVALSS